MSSEEIAREVAEAVAREIGGSRRGIVAERVYTPCEAAELCAWRGNGIKDPGRSFREGTKGRIPVVKLTAGGQRIGYYGRDLIRWIEESRER